MSDDLFERFKGHAVTVLAVDADKVTLEANFADDLDADSLDLVELVMALEDEFDVSIEEEELEGIAHGRPGRRPRPLQALSMEGRRVVVTGIGVVSPVGIGADAFWTALLGPARRGQDPRDRGLGSGSVVRRAQGRPSGRPLHPARRRCGRSGPRAVR